MAMAAPEAARNDPFNSQVLLIVLSIIFMVITATGISFRLYARIWVLKKVFLEDVLMVVGTLFAFGLSTCFTIGAFHGYGEQIAEINDVPGDLETVYKISFATTGLYAAANYFVKMSFLALYHRLDSRQPMRIAVYTFITIETVQLAAVYVAIALSWAPLPALLEGKVPIMSRTVTQIFYNASGILTAITSAAIYITPLLMLHYLRLPARQKIVIGALFSLGFLSTAATCIKTYYWWSIITALNFDTKTTTACVWMEVEVHAAIICGSAQAFRVLLKGFCSGCCGKADDDSSCSQSMPDFLTQTCDRRASSASLSSTLTGHEPNAPRTVHNSWKDWEILVSDSTRSATPTPTSARAPRMVEVKSRTCDTVAMPPGIYRHYPKIGSRTRIGDEESGMQNGWMFESTNDTETSLHWPWR